MMHMALSQMRFKTINSYNKQKRNERIEASMIKDYTEKRLENTLLQTTS